MESRSLAPQAVDRKLELLVKELRPYRVAVAGILETKWFGMEVWPADGIPFFTPEDRYQVMVRGLQGIRELESHWTRKLQQYGRKLEKHGKLSLPV